MSKSNLSTSGMHHLQNGKDAIANGELSEAVRIFDDLQISDPASWQAQFYCAYAGAYESVAKLQVANIMQFGMVAGEVKSRVEGLSKRIRSVVAMIHKDRVSEVQQSLGEVIDAICEWQSYAYKWLAKIKNLSERPGNSVFNDNKSVKKIVGELGDIVASVGYGLGDELKNGDTQKYKESIIKIWKSSCEGNIEVYDDLSVYGSYYEELKKLDPSVNIKPKKDLGCLWTFLAMVLIVGFIALKIKSCLGDIF